MENTHVYCAICGSIQPMMQSPLGGTDDSGRFANPIDIMCGKCGLVVATTYRRNQSSAEALRDLVRRGLP